MRQRSVILRGLESRAFWPVTLSLGLGLRVAWAYFTPSEPVSDFAWYFARALDVLEGRGYSVEGTFTAFWPSGYPLFLALVFAIFGAKVWVVMLANAALGVTGVWLAYRLGKEWFAGEATARVLALILAIYPNAVMYTSLVASEPLFVVFLLGALLLLGRCNRSPSWALAAGVACGCAVWVRPLAIVPLLVAAIWRFGHEAKGRRRWAAAAAVTGFVLALAPWTLRNWAVFGGFVFVSTNGGYNLLIGNHPGASGGWQEVRDLVPAQGNERELDVRFRALALESIASDPMGFLGRMPVKLNRLYGQGWDAVNWNLAGMGKVSPRRAALFRACRTVAGVSWKSLLILGLVGAVLAWKIGRRIEASPGSRFAPLLIIVSISAVHAVFFGDPRFQYPLVPFVGLYASVAVAWALGGFASSSD